MVHCPYPSQCNDGRCPFRDADCLERVAIRNACAALVFRQAEASPKYKEAANQVVEFRIVVADNNDGDSICSADSVATNASATAYFNNSLSRVWRTHQMQTKQVAAVQNILFDDEWGKLMLVKKNGGGQPSHEDYRLAHRGDSSYSCPPPCPHRRPDRGDQEGDAISWLG